MRSYLQKILTASASEIKCRCLQYANRVSERLHISPQTRLLTDRELLEKLGLDPSSSRSFVLQHFRDRAKPMIFPSFSQPEKTVSVLNSLSNVESVISSADNICDGTFKLLGSDDLRFRSQIPDWHFEPLSGKRSPLVHWTKIDELKSGVTGDKKVIWELNRHQYFVTLGQAYWITKDEKYSHTFVGHITSWMNENPPKMGVNWLSSLELAFRSISWILAIYYFKDSPTFTADLLQRILKYLYLHGRHIETYLSTYYSPNTHLTGEALGLYFLGTFFPEFDAASRWKSLGYGIMMDTLDIHVRDDGTYCEQSSHYLRYTIDFYCSLLVLRRLEGAAIDPKLLTKLNRLFDFLLHISQPNGETPNFGDDDGGRLYKLDGRSVTDLRPVFALGAVLLDRGDLKHAAETAGTEVMWLLGPEGVNKFNDLDRSEPLLRTSAFSDGGFFSARSNWTGHANSVLIHCGPFGFLNGGHAHAHTLGFHLNVAGGPVFVDSGTFNYTSDPDARNYFRSTFAHNCLTVEDSPSSVVEGPFSWKSTASARLLEWSESPNGVRFRGTHNGFRRFGVRYEREIVLDNDGPFEVVEHLDSDRRNRFQIHFILSPEISVEIVDTESRLVLTNTQANQMLTMKASFDGGHVEPEGWALDECFVSPVYGTKVKSHKLTCRFAGSGVLKIRNRILKIKK